MSVTVQDCLRLPAFHSARVIAGKNGLGRIVSSVSVVEIPEKAVESISVFNPNELLITSFFQLKTIRIDNVRKYETYMMVEALP